MKTQTSRMLSVILLTLFFALSVAPAKTGGGLPERSGMDPEYQWRLSDIYATDAAWEQDFEKLPAALAKIEPLRGKLGDSAENLCRVLKLEEELDLLYTRLSFYARRKADEDTRVTRYQGFKDRLNSFDVEWGEKTAFIRPEILRIPEDRIWKFVDEYEPLHIYRHFFEKQLSYKPHVLEEPQEQLMARVGDMAGSPEAVFTMFNNADIKFPFIRDEDGREVELTKARYSLFSKSPNREVRRAAFRAMYGTYNKWINTLAANLAGEVKKNVFYARARNFDSALQAALFGKQLPVSVYDNLIRAMNANLEPLHKYISLRKQILGVDKVHAYDISVPLIEDVEWEIPYTEAAGIVQQALRPLGEDYISALQGGLRGGWIDVYENQGKRSGAYSASAWGLPHPFILLNYQDQIGDMFTLAHELGHSLHAYHSHRMQPYVYGHYTSFNAEVASTFNEALLTDYLLKHTTDLCKKLFVLNEYIEGIKNTVYVQTMFAEFEKTVHEKAEAGEPLNAQVMNRIFGDIYKKYYGPDFELDDLAAINWCRIPHFYMNFYVFQYATGMSASAALAEKVLSGDPAAREAYLEFISSGSSDYSLNLLKAAGVDMTTAAPIEATAQLFARLVDEMEKTLNELDD